MLDRIINAALDTAETMRGMSASEADDFVRQNPRRSRFGSLFRRKKAEPKTVPGSKVWIARLFDLARGNSLTLKDNRVSVRIGGISVNFQPGSDTFKLLSNFGLPADLVKYDGILRGDVVDIGEGRLLKLPAEKPLPDLSVHEDSLVFAWNPHATVKQGWFTASLNGIGIYPEYGIIDVEWSRLGFDLAKNPVIWWAD